ncbi:MAG: terminase family protein [Ignavibacterium sp.]|nr:terminase family protein [Ignavibacterium sp.]
MNSLLDYNQIEKLLQTKKGRETLLSVGFTEEDLSLIEINIDPKKWAKAYLNWEARDYQEIILEKMRESKLLVLRLGRRLGKSDSMVVDILWHAYVQPNKGPNNQYDILIICPYEDQVDLIFKRIKQLIQDSPMLKQSIKRDIHHQIELYNGTVIKGLTAGSKNNSGAANTRGQRADLIVLDEADYMNDSDITNIINIRNEAPERIKIVVASTPSGARSMYYRLCTGATYSYTYLEEDSKIKGKATYKETYNKNGNGWVHIHAPSTVNKELLKINPDTGKTYLEELKETLTELRYVQEVLAEFGESEKGVYQKQYIDNAVTLGRQLNIVYETKDYKRRGPRILGVDWDDKHCPYWVNCWEVA